jgi:hypothetical protein
LTVWNGYRAIVQEGKSDVRRLVPEVNTSGTSANGDTNCGILEQYQRHIKIESIMGNADVALSLLARSCKFLWASCTFGLSQTAKDGYKFGYRHQFGLITENYAKLLKEPAAGPISGYQTERIQPLRTDRSGLMGCWGLFSSSNQDQLSTDPAGVVGS